MIGFIMGWAKKSSWLMVAGIFLILLCLNQNFQNARITELVTSHE